MYSESPWFLRLLISKFRYAPQRLWNSPDSCVCSRCKLVARHTAYHFSSILARRESARLREVPMTDREHICSVNGVNIIHTILAAHLLAAIWSHKCELARIALYWGTKVRFWIFKFHFRTYCPFSDHGGAHIEIPTIFRARISHLRGKKVRLELNYIP